MVETRRSCSVILPRMRLAVHIFRLIRHCSWRPITWVGLAAKARHQICRRLFTRATALNDKRLAEERAIANTWCAERAVEIGDLSPLLPFSFVAVSLAETFSQLLHVARERLATCPIEFGGAGHLDLLYSLAQAVDARRVVETGVGFGWSSLALLLAIADRNDHSLLCSVDFPYISEWSTNWIGAAVPRELRGRWRLFRMADRQGLPRALRQARPVDLAHYDSDKSPQGRLFGYGTIWDSLRIGGILVSDDVGDNLAFKRFAEHVGRTPIVVRWNNKYQGLLVK